MITSDEESAGKAIRRVSMKPTKTNRRQKEQVPTIREGMKGFVISIQRKESIIVHDYFLS
jgi:hypothetical protein